MTEDIEEIKEEQPLVSVVIPVYNRSKELSRAIKSVLNQTHQHFEILVVDDGSQEDLKAVCDFFNDQRIKFLRNDIHTNANVARNRGIKEAKGEYVAMLDSDDTYLPHHLNRRIEKIKEWNCDGIFGSAYIDNGEERTLKLSRPLQKGELMINYLLSDGFAPTPSHFYKTSAAKEIMWDESLFRHQDYDFSVRFAEKYSFKSDYEPTIKINWAHVKTLSNEYFYNCVKYYSLIEKEIKTPNKIKYLFLMLNLSKNNIINKDIRLFYKKQLLKNIKFLSLSQYLEINNAMHVLMRIRYRLKFSIITLLKI